MQPRTNEEMKRLYCPVSGDKCMGKDCACCAEDTEGMEYEDEYREYTCGLKL